MADYAQLNKIVREYLDQFKITTLEINEFHWDGTTWVVTLTDGDRLMGIVYIGADEKVIEKKSFPNKS